MPTSRERILQTQNFQTPDRLPKDLGGMRSTGISVFAYPKLVAALGLSRQLDRACLGAQHAQQQVQQRCLTRSVPSHHHHQCSLSAGVA